jgi:hypothetical protein
MAVRPWTGAIITGVVIGFFAALASTRARSGA